MLPVLGFHAVTAVREGREGYLDGVGLVEAGGLVGDVPGLVGLLGTVLGEGDGGLVKVLEDYDYVVFIEFRIQALALHAIYEVLHGADPFGNELFVPGEGLAALFEGFGTGVDVFVTCVVGGLGVPEFVELVLEEVSLREEAGGGAFVLFCQLFEGFDAGVLFSRDLVIVKGCVQWIFAADFLPELVLCIPVAAGGDAPQDVLGVIRYEVGERSAKETSYAAEKRLCAAFHRVCLYVPIEGVRTGAVVLVHPDEGYHGVSEILHFLLQCLLCGFAFLPVPSGDCFHVEGCGVVEVNAQVLLLCLGFYFLEDFGLGLGLVGVLGFLVLVPEAC